jgi:hypothetical protein
MILVLIALIVVIMRFIIEKNHEQHYLCRESGFYRYLRGIIK